METLTTSKKFYFQHMCFAFDACFLVTFSSDGAKHEKKGIYIVDYPKSGFVRKKCENVK